MENLKLKKNLFASVQLSGKERSPVCSAAKFSHGAYFREIFAVGVLGLAVLWSPEYTLTLKATQT